MKTSNKENYLPQQSQWKDHIYQLETTDPVQGGPGGIANRQATDLACRTVFLKDQIQSLCLQDVLKDGKNTGQETVKAKAIILDVFKITCSQRTLHITHAQNGQTLVQLKEDGTLIAKHFKVF